MYLARKENVVWLVITTTDSNGLLYPQISHARETYTACCWRLHPAGTL